MMFLMICLFMIVAIAAIPLSIRALTAQSRADAKAPRMQAPAMVMDKRSSVSGGGESPVRQTYFATFELTTGQRLELRLPGDSFGQLVDGDQGLLYWQGSSFKGFDRAQLPRGPQDMPRLNG